MIKFVLNILLHSSALGVFTIFSPSAEKAWHRGVGVFLSVPPPPPSFCLGLFFASQNDRGQVPKGRTCTPWYCCCGRGPTTARSTAPLGAVTGALSVALLMHLRGYVTEKNRREPTNERAVVVVRCCKDFIRVSAVFVRDVLSSTYSNPKHALGSK